MTLKPRLGVTQGLLMRRPYISSRLRTTCAGCPETTFLCFSRTASRRISTRHRRFPGAREMREARRRLGACVRVRRAHFEHEF